MIYTEAERVEWDMKRFDADADELATIATEAYHHADRYNGDRMRRLGYGKRWEAIT